jgi:zinc transport system substrate-binding protein
MMKKVAALLFVLLFSFTLAACSDKQSGNTEGEDEIVNSKQDGKITVMVSFNPLKEFTQAIGGDRVNVQNIIPEGMEPHDFEPKAKDIENINKSQIFIYNGLGMETWADKVLSILDNKGLIVVEASKQCQVIEIEDEHQDDKDHSHEHGQYDPHTWLSLKEAKTQSLLIKDALVKADPSGKDFYEKNYSEFALKLDTLFNEYKVKFDSIKNRHFVTGHAAFSYLCRDFGLKQNSIEDVFAEGEPSPKALKELVDYCRKNNVKTIFAEEMASPKVSETLAKEIGAKVEKIYTIESKEENRDYIEGMRDNLEKIYASLK